jgi:hypothetical protein
MIVSRLLTASLRGQDALDWTHKGNEGFLHASRTQPAFLAGLSHDPRVVNGPEIPVDPAYKY